MKVTTCVAVGVLLAPLLGSADTGFLDRSVHIGAMTYRYQVYVPIEHSRAKEWPVVIELHGNGAQGPDGLLPTAQGLAQQIRLNRSRFPAVVVFPQAEAGKRWLNADMHVPIRIFHGDADSRRTIPTPGHRVEKCLDHLGLASLLLRRLEDAGFKCSAP